MKKNENILEDEFDIAEELLRTRMRLKKLSQLSYELKSIENTFPTDYYEMTNAENMLKLYKVIESKVIEVALDIQNKN